ncbi:hypothetical protein BYT27DRAFT_7196696 [Phlegmacium glaucopus]|nr:hypothetical protein BYT27DRAFT_7196696 [Phlegmacium glaucopus]
MMLFISYPDMTWEQLFFHLAVHLGSSSVRSRILGRMRENKVGKLVTVKPRISRNLLMGIVDAYFLSLVMGFRALSTGMAHVAFFFLAPMYLSGVCMRFSMLSKPGTSNNSNYLGP